MPASGGKEEKGEDSPHDSADESEDDESEILEESPCGRWQKRRVKVEQRDVPGIDVAYLAMDTEEGREVVWNEVQFSARRDFKAQEEKIKVVFDNLIQLEHPNIVKFYKYWADTKSDKEKPRVIFITEYMSSGSLKQFLMKVKKDMHYVQEKSWKRWTTQILSALSYLHSCEIPIVHGNLTTDTIFIQHNGLIKIGCVAPDAIHSHVKTYREEQKNMHYLAPEYGANQEKVTIGADIYAFGICALEMAVVNIQSNGDSKKKNISRSAVNQAVNGLKDAYQKDFIRKCLCDQTKRPTARDLLLHRVLFEVHSLKLLAAHCIVHTETMVGTAAEFESEVKELTDDQNRERVMASITHKDGRSGVQRMLSDVPALELEKFLEDVKNGVYPLTAFALPRPQPTKKNRPQSPETESVKSETPEPSDVESRHIQEMNCNVKAKEDDLILQLEIHLRMDDKMRRELSCEISKDDKPQDLADELVDFGFINKTDRDQISRLIEERLMTFNASRYINPNSAVRTT